MTLDELKAAIAALIGEADGGEVYAALDDFGRMSDGFASKVETLEGERDEWKRKYEETAARNYELMTAVTAEAEENAAEDEAAEDEAADISKLFKDE